MIKPVLAPALAMFLTVSACSRPAPVDTSLIAIPAPMAGLAQLYAGTGDSPVAVKSRTGDCVKTACFIFEGNRWKPLDASKAKTTALLSIEEATGSRYGEDIWRMTGPNRAILINATAGNANIVAGQFDGLRIGLRDGAHLIYVTAYAIERGSDMQAAGKCLSGVGCAKALGNGLYLSPVEASIVAAGGTAWLLQHRPDRSANLVDLYAILVKPEKILCLPGLALDTGGTWAGPPDKALSPDIFVSRKVDPASVDAQRRTVLAKCAATGKKP